MRAFFPEAISWRSPRIAVAVALLAGLALLPAVTAAIGEPFYVTLAARIVIYALAACGLNLVLGYGGLVSFGHALYVGLGAYVVEVELGRGPATTVLRARAADGTPVAIKVLDADPDPVRRRRFVRERSVARSLDHPYLAPALDEGVHRGREYLVSAFASEGTLQARLEQGPLETDELVDVVWRVGGAVVRKQVARYLIFDK